MRTFINQFELNIKYARPFHLVKLVAITGGTQAIIQVTGLIGGLLIIRLIPVQEYAYYTIANAMLGTMTMLSDGGISNGVMAQGGKVWQDKDKLGVVLATGLELRKKFAAVSFLIFTPILIYLLLHQGASWLASLAIALALVPAFFANLSDSLLEVVPKLHQNIKELQLNQFIVSIARLVLTCLLIAVFPLTATVLIANGLPRIYGNIKLKVLAGRFALLNASPDIQARKAILEITKKTLPVVIFYSFSSQLSIWLLSIFSNSSNIADMGALSRLTMFTSFISILLSHLIFPRFARIPSEKTKNLAVFFTTIQGLLIILCFILTGATWLFSSFILRILGSAYSSLSHELVLSVVSACMGLLISCAGSLINSRGWVINPIIVIAINIISLLISIQLFNFSHLAGVISYNILMNLIFYTFILGYAVYKFRRLSKIVI
jgi:O-antigen/teichoic acid export membrane protein